MPNEQQVFWLQKNLIHNENMAHETIRLENTEYESFISETHEHYVTELHVRKLKPSDLGFNFNSTVSPFQTYKAPSLLTE